MAKSGDASGSSLADQVDALGQTLAALSSTIEFSPDPEAALNTASHLADLLRDAADSAAELRARVLLRIYEERRLSLADLGALLGVSRARAGQLIQVAKKSRNLSVHGVPGRPQDRKPD